MKTGTLVACHECDLLQREIPLARRGKALCARCGATLYRSHPESLERTLAYTVGAVILFAIANAFPIVSLELGGQRIDATLFGAVRQLYVQEQRLVAGLVFFTTIFIPVIQLAALSYLLLPLRFHRLPREFAAVFRVLQTIRPWGMVEVFVLGVLVSLVKLAHLATIVPGIALGSFGGMMLLTAAAAAAFDPRELWMRVSHL